MAKLLEPSSWLLACCSVLGRACSPQVPVVRGPCMGYPVTMRCVHISGPLPSLEDHFISSGLPQVIISDVSPHGCPAPHPLPHHCSFSLRPECPELPRAWSLLQGLELGSEEQEKEQRGQRAGRVQEARVSFLPAVVRSALRLAPSLSPFPPQSVAQLGHHPVEHNLYFLHLQSSFKRSVKENAEGVMSSLSRRICP